MTLPIRYSLQLLLLKGAGSAMLYHTPPGLLPRKDDWTYLGGLRGNSGGGSSLSGCIGRVHGDCLQAAVGRITDGD